MLERKTRNQTNTNCDAVRF